MNLSPVDWTHMSLRSAQMGLEDRYHCSFGSLARLLRTTTRHFSANIRIAWWKCVPTWTGSSTWCWMVVGHLRWAGPTKTRWSTSS